MKSINFKLDTDLLKEKVYAEKGFCGIAIQSGEHIFPFEEYTDFTYTIVAGWNKVTLDFLTSKRENIWLEWMSGPYLGIGTADEKGLLTVQLGNSELDNNNEIYVDASMTVQITLHEFIQQLTQLSQQLLTTAKQFNIVPKGLDLLKSTHAQLSELG